MKTKVTGLIYFLTGTLFIISWYNKTNIFPMIFKASLMPIILLLLFLNLRVSENRSHIIMAAAFIFSCAGDILLQLNGPGRDLFIHGLGSFLLAQIMYIVVFLSLPGRNDFLVHRWYFSIPVIAYGLILIMLLYDDLSEMKVPVIIYATILLMMLAAAMNRFYKSRKDSYFLTLSGAVLFVISDSVIAIDRFTYHFKSSTLIIMLAYITAQFLIAMGYIKQFRHRFV